METSRSQSAAEDIAALLRARNPLIWVVTREEARAEQYLVQAAGAAGYLPRFWDVDQGVTSIDGRRLNIGGADPGDMLSAIRERTEASSPERGLWIMRDLPAWIEGPGGAPILRKLRNLARLLPATPRERAQAIVVLSPSSKVPDELAVHASVIEWPLPDRQEIGAILDAAVQSLPENMQAQAAPNGTRDAAIDAAIGLSGEETASCFARSIIKSRKIDATLVAREKRRVVAREGVLEWFDPLPGGLNNVGGLDNLKGWLTARASAYSSKAREYGLPAPKGAMLVGVPGCGKSLTAKAIATAWNVPLLRLDLGALKSKFVGDSEQNLRKALRIIEVIGRCVVWLDEIEKSLQGATSGSADGGVSSDALGAILSWMQDRRGEAFVIATANDVSSLPPELLRKGRFDELWFIDLPTEAERTAILTAALRAHGRTVDGIEAIAASTDGFTGAELAALVPDALFAAFNDGQRAPLTADLIQAAATVVPLSRTASEKITKLRDWAVGRARRATSADAEGPARSNSRNLDL